MEIDRQVVCREAKNKWIVTILMNVELYQLTSGSSFSLLMEDVRQPTISRKVEGNYPINENERTLHYIA